MVNKKLQIPAWDLLVEQPKSLSGMTAEQRNALVISAVTLSDGTSEVVSRFGDRVWKLDAYIVGAGVTESAKRIEWPEDCGQAMVDSLKAICFAWKHRGRNELAPPQWQKSRLQEAGLHWGGDRKRCHTGRRPCLGKESGSRHAPVHYKVNM